VVAGIAVALVLVMGGSKSSSGAKGALDKLLNAAKSHDAKTAQSLTCPPLSDAISTSPFLAATKWSIGKADENGDSASVPFSVTIAGADRNYTASAQKQSGNWKICDVQEGGSGGGGGGGGDAGAAQQNVQKLLQAAKDKDLATAKSLSCAPLSGRLDQVPPIDSFQVGSGTVSGSSGTVPFKVTSDGKSYDEVAEVTKESDTWKVCDFHDASGGTGSGPAPSDTNIPTGLPSGFPSNLPSNLPTGLPTGGGTGSFCITPNGSTPICIPQ
jgi:hypothetical protein